MKSSDTDTPLDIEKVLDIIFHIAKKPEDISKSIYIINSSTGFLSSGSTQTAVAKKCDEYRTLIAASFIDYCLSYAFEGYYALKRLSSESSFSAIIPAVYMTHHTVELFCKAVKFDAYRKTVAEKEWEFTIKNVVDLNVKSHDIVDKLDDDDCKAWFESVNGNTFKCLLQIQYDEICYKLNTDHLAESMRFPMDSKGYVLRDYTSLSAKDIAEIENACVKVIGVCIILLTRKLQMDLELRDALLKKSIDSVGEDNVNT